MIAAAIAIGSNSTRLLVAECADRVIPLLRQMADTRLMQETDARGNLTEEGLQRTLNAVREMQIKALSMGAEQIELIATSASRDAANGQQLTDRIFEETGLSLRIISGKEEAEYAYRAICEDGEFITGFDIGGGSTEIVSGCGKDLSYAVSAQAGSSRFLKIGAIKSIREILIFRDIAQKAIEDVLSDMPVLRGTGKLVGLGGVCTTLGAIRLQEDFLTDRSETVCITYDEAQAILLRIASMSVKERERVQGIPSSRVMHIPHGLCILLEVMKALGFKEFYPTVRTNMDGMLKKYCR